MLKKYFFIKTYQYQLYVCVCVHTHTHTQSRNAVHSMGRVKRAHFPMIYVTVLL